MADVRNGAAGGRAAAVLLAAGGVAVALAALPYKAFDLDRFFVPKELVLHATALAVVLTLLPRARRLSLTRVDTLLAAFLALSTLSALFARNPWLAWRALAISLSGGVVFWGARAVSRAGRGGLLVGGMLIAIVVVATTALLQAYGVDSEYVSLNRAPGGTLGNRNFVAHLAAIGAPVLLAYVIALRRRWAAVLGVVGMVALSAALVLSRSRAAWLALIAAIAVFAIAGFARLALWRGAGAGPRLRLLAISAAIGAVAAAYVPNVLNWRSESPYLDSMRGMVNYRAGSGRGRLLQYRNTLRMSIGHPVLGVGPGNWPVWYPRYASTNDPSLDDDDGMTSNPWPSSDWVAIVSERGVVAGACLVLVFIGLGVVALTAIADAASLEALLPRLGLLGAVAGAVVVMAFDALLLLPAPALIVWAMLGALAPPARERAAVELAGRRRMLATAAVIVLGAAAIARSAAQTAAMAAFRDGRTIAAMLRASRWDPGSYAIQIRLAEAYAREERCDGVRRHATRARTLFPSAPEPPRLLRRCRGA